MVCQAAYVPNFTLTPTLSLKGEGELKDPALLYYTDGQNAQDD